MAAVRPDAALYWLARMLEAGEDPLYVARRLVRFASEDIGLADNQALRIALDAKEAFEFIGLPEGKLALAQCVVYLAAAPKSNSVYTAYLRVSEDVAQTRNDPVPLHIRNAPTRLMKGLGYGKGYQYSHDVEGKLPGWIASRNLLRSIAIFLCPGIWRRSRNQTPS